MRPVNLIPPEDRRGEASPSRSGPLAYLVVGALALALLGVAAVVLTNNQIADRQQETEDLHRQVAETTARAESLAAYTQFHAVRAARSQTIASLAESRFDWQRVIKELSLVIPPDVWLTNLTGTAAPSVTLDDGAGVGGRDAVPGPALELVGCAPGQESVARFITALKEIEGVTRVGVQRSSLPGDAGGSSSTSSSCQTRNFIAQFEIVVAFDAAPVTAPTTPGAVAPPPADATSTDTASTDASATSTSTGG